jgi:hypothetical protein
MNIATRIINIVIPRSKSQTRTLDRDPVLQNYKCQRLIEAYVKEHLPETQHVAIIWVDKDNMVSSAYCNISPFNRLWLLFVAWCQELIDYKVEKRGEK